MKKKPKRERVYWAVMDKERVITPTVWSCRYFAELELKEIKKGWGRDFEIQCVRLVKVKGKPQ